MKIKKFVTTFLLVTFITLSTSPLANEVSANTNDDSLYNFLKTTDNIKAAYKYPNMRLSSNATNKITLAAHTPIIIRCNETISTKEVVSGSTVNFSVVSDVKSSNGIVLIKAGTPATAQITFSKPRGRIGQSGELIVSDFHTIAIDGTYIPLSGSISSKQDDKMVLSIVLSVLVCPLFLLMRGEDAQLPAGTTKTSYTVTNVYIAP